jgi:hypothetical protein
MSPSRLLRRKTKLRKSMAKKQRRAHWARLAFQKDLQSERHSQKSTRKSDRTII